MVAFKKKSNQSSSALLGFAQRVRNRKGEWKLKFNWGRIFVALLILGITAWITLFSGAYFYIKHKHKYDEISYWKTLLIPFRYTAHKKELGDYLIKEGLKHFDNEKYSKAFFFLRNGLSRSPTNTKGLIHLAKFYLPDRTDVAIKLLENQIHIGIDDIDYITSYFQILMSIQEDNKIITKVNELIPKTTSRPIKSALALFATSSYFYRGQYDDAESMINEYRLDKTLEGYIISTGIAWHRGQRALAVKKLEAGLDKGPNSIIYSRLSDYYYTMEDFANARKFAILNNALNPNDIAPRIMLIKTLTDDKQLQRKNREIEQIIEQYSDDSSSLAKLADYAAKTANIELSEQLYEHAQDNEFKLGLFALGYMESNVRAGKHKTVIDFTEKSLKESPRPAWIDNYNGVFNCMRALAYYAMDNQNLSDIYLDKFISDRSMRTENLLSASKLFEELGGMQRSRKILNTAYENNKSNQAALTNLIRVDLLLGNASNLSQNIQKLLKMRRPSKEVVKQAQQTLGSDRFIFTQNREGLLMELGAILEN